MYKLYKIIYTCIIVMLVLSKKRGTQHHHHLSSKTANLATQSCFPLKKKRSDRCLIRFFSATFVQIFLWKMLKITNFSKWLFLVSKIGGFSESWFWDILSIDLSFTDLKWRGITLCKSPDLFTSPRYNHFLDTWCVTAPLHSFLSCLPGLQAIQVLPLCQSVEVCYLGCCQCLDAIVATTGRVDAKNTIGYLPSTNNHKQKKGLDGFTVQFGDVTMCQDWGKKTRLAKQISNNLTNISWYLHWNKSLPLFAP